MKTKTKPSRTPEDRLIQLEVRSKIRTAKANALGYQASISRLSERLNLLSARRDPMLQQAYDLLTTK